MQWDCWHLLEGHMEKGGVLEVVTKNTARITGVFSATSANAGSPVSPDRPVTQGTAAPTLAPSQGASPDMRRTIVVPTKDHRRFMFGFRLKAKSEHEATMVRRWSLVGTAMVGGWRRNGGGDGRGGGYTHGVGGAGRGDTHGGCRRRAGESSRCEDTAPTVGIAGYTSDHHLRPHGHQWERRTEDHDATLVREGTCVARHLPYQAPY